MRSDLAARAETVRLALRDPEALGLVGLRRSGRGWSGRCPLHEDTSPSFSVRSYDDGLGWICFAGCGKGDGIDLLARLHGLDARGPDFRQVVEIGERLAGIAPGSPPPPRVRPPAPKPEEDARDLAERRAIQDRVHAVLLEVAPLGDEARAYLCGRGFRDDEIPGDWCELPPPADQRRVVAALEAELGRDAWRELSGLASKDGAGFAWSDHRLVIPWRGGASVQAPVALLQRRRLDNGTRGPKYVSPAGLTVPSPFSAEDDAEIGGDASLMVCEGALDALALRVLGREAGRGWWAVGLLGVSAWRSEWATLGAGRGCFVALDPDTAGEAAVERIALDLEAAGAATVERARPLAGADWCATLQVLRTGRAAA